MDCEIAYEELAAFADGDLEAGRLREIREHLQCCRGCADRLRALQMTDAVLESIPRVQPSAGAILAARRAVSATIRRPLFPEIMTLADAAEFLRITPDQLGEIVEELPAFELSGQVRVRRERLLEWVQQRERDYVRQRSDSWAARAGAVGLGRG